MMNETKGTEAKMRIHAGTTFQGKKNGWAWCRLTVKDSIITYDYSEVNCKKCLKWLEGKKDSSFLRCDPIKI